MRSTWALRGACSKSVSVAEAKDLEMEKSLGVEAF